MKRIAILALIVAALAAPVAAEAQTPTQIAVTAYQLAEEPGTCRQVDGLVHERGLQRARHDFEATKTSSGHPRYWGQVFTAVYLVCNR